MLRSDSQNVFSGDNYQKRSPMIEANSNFTGNMGAGAGQFQQNAYMMMSPYQMYNPGMPNAGYPMGMAMGGYPMLQPGMMLYPPMQMGMMMPAGAQMGMDPSAQGLDSRTAHAYFSSSTDKSHPSHPGHHEVEKRHRQTEDAFRGLGEYLPTKSAGDGHRKFTPYSIEDYKVLSRTHGNKLGGLGANFDGDWEDKIKKNEKTKEFSKMIRGINSEKISKQVVKSKEPIKEVTTRDKAIAFAKQVPKPKQKRKEGLGAEDDKKGNKNSTEGKEIEGQVDQQLDEVDDDLNALERQHLYYQQKINQLKP